MHWEFSAEASMGKSVVAGVFSAAVLASGHADRDTRA
jgi:hypothetical protein